jgi:hypothetical protein
MQSTIFKMMKQRKVLTLWSGKYGTYINFFKNTATMSETPILLINGSMLSGK